MEIDLKRVEDAIVAEVSDRIVDESGLNKIVQEKINSRIDKIFEMHAQSIIDEAINKAIKDGFERSYRRVDSFGNSIGEPTTIRSQLEKLISGYWDTRVDKHGKPDTSSYGDKMTRAEWLMTQLVAKDFEGEMKQHVVNVGGALKDQLRSSLHGTVNQLLSEVFKVKSQDDQILHRTGDACIQPAVK